MPDRTSEPQRPAPAHPTGRRYLPDVRGEASGARDLREFTESGLQLQGSLRGGSTGGLRNSADLLHAWRLHAIYTPRLGRARVVPNEPDSADLGVNAPGALSQLPSGELGPHGGGSLDRNRPPALARILALKQT